MTRFQKRFKDINNQSVEIEGMRYADNGKLIAVKGWIEGVRFYAYCFQDVIVDESYKNEIFKWCGLEGGALEIEYHTRANQYMRPSFQHDFETIDSRGLDGKWNP